MFAKLSILALVLPFVSGFTINSITSGTTGGTVTITWTASTTDSQYFSIELVNAAFNNEYAIATNVQTSLGSLSLTLPQVPPGDGYSLQAIAVNNVNQVYAQSGDFAIGAATTTSSSAASTTSGATSSSSGTLSTPSTTAPVSSVTPATASGTSTSAASTPSSFNSSGAASFKMPSTVPAAALLLSAVAGAAMVF